MQSFGYSHHTRSTLRVRWIIICRYAVLREPYSRYRSFLRLRHKLGGNTKNDERMLHTHALPYMELITGKRNVRYVYWSKIGGYIPDTGFNSTKDIRYPNEFVLPEYPLINRKTLDAELVLYHRILKEHEEVSVEEWQRLFSASEAA